jgi:hypothetical protein
MKNLLTVVLCLSLVACEEEKTETTNCGGEVVAGTPVPAVVGGEVAGVPMTSGEETSPSGIEAGAEPVAGVEMGGEPYAGEPVGGVEAGVMGGEPVEADMGMGGEPVEADMEMNGGVEG